MTIFQAGGRSSGNNSLVRLNFWEQMLGKYIRNIIRVEPYIKLIQFDESFIEIRCDVSSHIGFFEEHEIAILGKPTSPDYQIADTCFINKKILALTITVSSDYAFTPPMNWIKFIFDDYSSALLMTYEYSVDMLEIVGEE